MAIRKQKGGFAILEALLAVMLCGIMATGLVVAIQRISKLSFQAKRESDVSRIVHNHLFQTTTRPQIQEGTSSKQLEEWGVELETIIEPLENLENQDAAVLNRLYRVEVNAIWWEDGEYVKRTAETWRHLDLYAR